MDNVESKNKEGEDKGSGGRVFASVVIVIVVFMTLIIIAQNPFQFASTQSSNSSSTTNQINSTVVTSPSQGAVPNQQPQNNSEGLSPSVIAQIEPSVVEINCYSVDNSIESSGSGVSYYDKQDGLNLIETNYHVYAGAVIGGLVPNCYAVFPESPNFTFNSSYGDYQISLYNWHYNPSIYEDSAIFELGAPISTSIALTSIPQINDFYKSIDSVGQCDSSTIVNVGDGVTIFGYPASGNLLGISETVTTGIVSGVLSGPIYKTNAAIDHGNSGGVAILNKNYCSLGIPTYGNSGLTAGIGYIESYILAAETTN